MYDKRTAKERHEKEMKKWNIDVPEEHTKVPFIYNTAKQHKNPIGNRFIVSGKHCTTKRLSKCLSFCFQLIRAKTMKYDAAFKCKFLKTKAYWVIKNSADIRQDITSINSNNKAKSIYSYDFSKLYTNIPHDLLIENMKFVVEEAFKIKGDCCFIKLNNKSANCVRICLRKQSC